jgi:LPXTG-motif cell wall-anchored protein
VIVDEDTPPGGEPLAGGMFLTIKDGDKEICSGTFRDADEEGNVRVGSMAPGEEKILDFYADFPDEESGNEYQGSSMKVQWVFTTQSSGGGGGGGGGGGRRRGGGEEEEITVDEPDIFVPPEEPVTVEDEPLPGMPKTGEGLPYPFYLAGACAIVAGVGLLRKKNKS